MLEVLLWGVLFILRLTEGLKGHLIRKKEKMKINSFQGQENGDPLLEAWYLITFT